MGAFFVRTGSPNKWDEEWENGTYNTDGNKAENNSYIRSKNKIKVIPSSTIYIKAPNGGNICYYDNNETFISRSSYTNFNTTYTIPNNCYYITFFSYGTTYNNNICINISNPLINGNYYPYVPNSRMQIADWHSRLPSGYVEVEYLESHGTEYIDTLLKINQYDTIETDFSYLNLPNYVVNMCGTRSTDNNAISHLRINQYNVIEPWFGNGLNSNVTMSSNTKYKVKTYGVSGSQSIYIDGELKATATMSYVNNSNFTSFIFAMNESGSPYNRGSFRLYTFKMSLNNTLVRDFIPAVRLADGEAGLYDVVNDVFYTNAGTGKFTYGEFKNIPSGYAQINLGTLDYVRSLIGSVYVFNVSIQGMANAEGIISIYTNQQGHPYSLPNKAFTCGSSDYGASWLSIRDDSYTDATTFENANSGVWLLYKKA